MQAIQTRDTPPRTRPVRDIVERMDRACAGDHVSLRDILAAFGTTAFLPPMMALALLVVSPLSGVPLFSSAVGLSIMLIAGQMLAGRDTLWLPEFLLRRRISGRRGRAALDRLRGVADWIDGHTERRLTPLTAAPMRRLVPLFCFVCGMIMPLLELVPFSSSLLGLAVLSMCTALLVRDGLVLVAGLACVALAALLPLAVLF